MTVALSRRSTDGTWIEVASAGTDADGRVRDLAPQGLEPVDHRLVFDTAAYFAATGQTGFYPEVAITFCVADERHYHVPLLLSPFAFSTYRGS
jgi:5-hydroxyisourate hydrolase